MSEEYKTYPGREIFPVQSATGCMLKWNWSTVNMETGQSASCHRTQFVDIDPDNFANFHNLPEKIQDRKAMLAGEWPGRGCEYCRRIEDQGGTSDRVMTLQRHHGLDKVPPELLADPQATSVTPTILEVYFNNTCNLACLYCRPAQSSKWNDEVRKFGPITIAGSQIQKSVEPGKNYDQMVANLWQYLDENNRYKIIKHFNLLGGESLLQRELDMCLDFWADHPNPGLTFNMVTNLMLPHEQFKRKMQRFEQLVQQEAIYMLEITASLDCWGPEQEYLRHGLDLSVWQTNFEYLLDKPWVKLAIHSCINSLSIKTTPELISKIIVWNTQRPEHMPIDHSFDLVLGVGNQINGLHPTAFGAGTFDQDFATILHMMPDHTESQQSAGKQMQGLARYVTNSLRDHDKINNLITYLNELDRRRNTNWRRVFPWLANFEQPV